MWWVGFMIGRREDVPSGSPASTLIPRGLCRACGNWSSTESSGLRTSKFRMGVRPTTLQSRFWIPTSRPGRGCSVSIGDAALAKVHKMDQTSPRMKTHGDHRLSRRSFFLTVGAALAAQHHFFKVAINRFHGDRESRVQSYANQMQSMQPNFLNSFIGNIFTAWRTPAVFPGKRSFWRNAMEGI
jgi:hypothetical protein